MIRYSLLLVALISLFCLPSSAQEPTVSGAVTGQQGMPLAGVTVAGFQRNRGGGKVLRRTKTGDDGSFNLANVGRVIYFRQDGFRPATLVRAVDQSFMKVRLESDPPTQSSIPFCSDARKSPKRYGGNSLFVVPRGTKIKSHHGDDSWDVSVFFPGTREQLLIWSGSVGEGTLDVVDDDWILDSLTFYEKAIGFALDSRGTTKEGKTWRFFSNVGDIAQYHDASAAAAKFFDQIIDSVCARYKN